MVFSKAMRVKSCCEQTDGSLLIELSGRTGAKQARCGAWGSRALVHERSWRRVASATGSIAGSGCTFRFDGWTVITAGSRAAERISWPELACPTDRAAACLVEA